MLSRQIHPYVHPWMQQTPLNLKIILLILLMLKWALISPFATNTIIAYIFKFCKDGIKMALKTNGCKMVVVKFFLSKKSMKKNLQFLLKWGIT